MKTHHALPLIALVWALPAMPAMAQSQGGFSLPPNPAPTSTPQAQGPEDDSGIVPVGPRVIPTAPAPTPTPAPTPRPVTPRPSATPLPTATPRADAAPAVPRPRPTATSAPQSPQAAPAPVEQAGEALPQSTPTLPEASPTADAAEATPPPSLPTAAAPPMAQSGPLGDEPTDNILSPFAWIAAALAVLAAMVALLFYRRRRSNAAPKPIERPQPVARAGNAGLASDLSDLRVELEAVRVTRSMRNATLAYRLTLTNRGSQALRNMAVGGDLVSAHGQSPITDQLADPAMELPMLGTVDHLGAGQRKVLTGEMRLSLETVRTIRQGKVPIYIPLARVRVSDGQATPRAFTFVVGKQPQPGVGRLQPFRLDTPPQGFSDVGTRALT